MEISIPEKYNYENNFENIHNKRTVSAVPFKTILKSIDSVNGEFNKINNKINSSGYVDNKTSALCGIDEKNVNYDDAVTYDVNKENYEENENTIHSCYDCEVREDCLRFKENNDDILMDNNISLKTKYDPISRRNIPSFTDLITEDENNIHRAASVLYVPYLMSEHKRKINLLNSLNYDD